MLRAIEDGPWSIMGKNVSSNDFKLVLADLILNGPDQKNLIFLIRKFVNLILIMSSFRLNGSKTGSKLNYKFQTKILKQNAQIIQIKYI